MAAAMMNLRTPCLTSSQIFFCHGSGSALSATGNRLGRPPDPHRCNTDGLRPPTNRVAANPVRLGLAGGARRCPVVPVTTAIR